MDTRRKLTASTFEHKTFTNADGSRLRARRNGKTQTWKTRPNDFRIPIKHGLYTYADINDENHANWVITS